MNDDIPLKNVQDTSNVLGVFLADEVDEHVSSILDVLLVLVDGAI